MQKPNTNPEVVIIGAGLAGLACARRLLETQRSFVILDAAEAVGGRTHTDELDGFLLDRGFQTLLTAYPECRRFLNYRDLNLRMFASGFLIRHEGKFHRMGGLRTITSGIGTLTDKWRLVTLRAKLQSGDAERLFNRPEGLTLDLLRWHGFSDAMIDHYFRPLCGWLLLDRELTTSSRLFLFMFRMLGDGEIAVPAGGMKSIAHQFLSLLPAGSERLHSQVTAVAPGRVTLQSGETHEAKAIVVATEAPEATRLLGLEAPRPGPGVMCLYFAADRSPLNEPIIVLNAEAGPINHLAVVSDASPEYAPAGRSLVCASVLGVTDQDDAALEADVRGQLTNWFGSVVDSWKHLRTYRIRRAIPDMTAPALDPAERPMSMGHGLFVCGDHRDHAGMNGALHSGWRAAQAVGEYLAAAIPPNLA
ncbi:MAG: protoporphyrinogen/coproporphyrinogen oxidase [Gemmataceae bacterium]